MPAKATTTEKALHVRLLEGFEVKARPDGTVHTIRAGGKVVAECCVGTKKVRLNLRDIPAKGKTPKSIELLRPLEVVARWRSERGRGQPHGRTRAARGDHGRQARARADGRRSGPRERSGHVRGSDRAQGRSSRRTAFRRQGHRVAARRASGPTSTGDGPRKRAASRYGRALLNEGISASVPSRFVIEKVQKRGQVGVHRHGGVSFGSSSRAWCIRRSKTMTNAIPYAA